MNKKKIKFDILTIFPEMFPAYFGASMMKRAQENNHIEVNIHNLRDFAKDKHKMTDDVAYGGISGMVMKVEPVYYAVNSIKKKNKKDKVRVLVTSAKGKVMNQKKVRSLSKHDRIILIAGHYKGIDERVAKYIADEEISIGEYIITGGELSTMVIVDAVSRMISGVIGKDESKKGESFSSGVKHEHPVYTRPEVFSPENDKDWKVPEILLSGHHQKISEWRSKNRKNQSK
ncbi:MAG: tRNA (guanosine(37)-N1)-methyltransferase TrmD [Candidatus Paceibacterota bacterium]